MSKTRDIIEGLTILEKYRTIDDGFNCGAEHDTIYAFSTDTPVKSQDIVRLVELGWFQDDVEFADDGEFLAELYDPGESWACYT